MSDVRPIGPDDAPALCSALERADPAGLREFVSRDPVTQAFAGLGIDLAPLCEARLSLFRACRSLCPRTRLDIAGFDVDVSVSAAELWRFYLPLCQAAVTRRAAGEGGRTLIGVCGPGASGKSVFAALLAEVLDRAHGGERVAALCAMDGFHLPNAQLDSRLVPGPSGNTVPLRSLKGAPCTFDGAAFAECVAELKAGLRRTVPCYDRRLHDAVPDGGRIGEDCRFVVVEGNYLLLDEPPWDAVARHLDLSIFLAAPAEAVRRAMVARHMRGGRSREDAVAHYERVDAPNCRICDGTASRADLLVLRSATHEVLAIERPAL